MGGGSTLILLLQKRGAENILAMLRRGTKSVYGQIPRDGITFEIYFFKY